MTGASVQPPYALLAELTHRCPLRCLYCSNPIELIRADGELSTADWSRVISQAADLGVLQIHFSGGEPLLRDDLEQLIILAFHNGLYTNLITSGIGLDAARAAAIARSGLNSVQLSVQAADPLLSNCIAGRNAFAAKQAAAQCVLAAGLPLSMNVVLHSLNIDQLEAIIDNCVDWGADRIELANAQFYNWALLNRDELLPTRDQLKRAQAIYQRKKVELGNSAELIWIISDYHERYPKPCMGGWGRLQLTVAPDGKVMPCPVASTISTLQFESVKDRNLAWIWQRSPAFNQFRGFEWMPDPCKACDRRFEDFGGCRCQAFALTGSADRTDPVCHLSPDHHLVTAALKSASTSETCEPPTDDAGLHAFKRMRFRQPL